MPGSRAVVGQGEEIKYEEEGDKDVKIQEGARGRSNRRGRLDSATILDKSRAFHLCWPK